MDIWNGSTSVAGNVLGSQGLNGRDRWTFLFNEALPFSFPSFSPPLGGRGKTAELRKETKLARFLSAFRYLQVNNTPPMQPLPSADAYKAQTAADESGWFGGWWPAGPVVFFLLFA